MAADMEEELQVYSVSEITRDIKAILEAAFDTVWIEGEISNMKVAASQHAYFVLKDQNAQVRCVMFRGQRSRMKFKPEDGDQVVLLGRVTVYEARGDYQVIVEAMEPRGLGALQKAFEQLKEKLAKEGLFDEERKRPLPEHPWRVGIVTSPTGAAIRDMVHVLERRNPRLSILLNPVKVQGEGSAQEIARAIEQLNQVPDLDVIIIGRGGGSIEDLWAFNEEVVARAIHASRLPVISAVGHEIDFTISDFVADVRAPTPSAAAELVTPELASTIDELRDRLERLIGNMQDRIEDDRNRLRFLVDRRFFREPHRILESPAQRLDDISQRLMRGLDRWVVVQKQRLDGAAHRLMQASPQKRLGLLGEKRADLHHMLIRQIQSQIQLNRQQLDGVCKNLNALSPLSILDRGYSITTAKDTGKAVASSREVKAGERVQVRLAQGKLDCTVDKTLE